MSSRHVLTTVALAAGGLALLAGPALAAAPSSASVAVTNSGYSPATTTIAYGGTVTWQVKQGTHTVTDASKLKLFDSGSKAVGTTFAHRFPEAGTYTYDSTVGTAFTGQIGVPTTAKPATGSKTTFFTVRWATTSLPSGYGEAVQMKEPGAKNWISFVYSTVDDDATFRAADWGNKTGVYQLRSKLVKGDNVNVGVGWSPIASVTVH